MKNMIRATSLLAGMALIAIIFSHLALTDIYHNEGDLITEWWVLRFSALILLAFISSTFLTLKKAQAHISSRSE
jgi:hypothetical protein